MAEKKAKLETPADEQKQTKVTKKRTRTENTTTAKKKPAKTKKKKPVGEIPEDIWEQWPEENIDQYLKFCAYRDMAYEGNLEADLKKGYASIQKRNRRSMRKLVKQLGLRSYRSVDTLSVRFKWQERVNAYDLDVERRVREAHEAAIIKMTENHALLGEQMVKKAAKRILTMPEEEISAAEVARLADIGVRIERLSRGQSTENQSVSSKVMHEGAVTVEVEGGHDLSNLTDKELDQLEQLLEKATAKPNV